MFDGPEPIYVQIAQLIRAQILAGELAEDEQVMSTTQFATTFRINPATAAKAFAGLVDDGLLYKRRGLGMFVAPGARRQLLESHRTRYFDDVLAPALDEADVLGITADEIVAYVRSHRPDPASPATTSTTEEP